MNNITIIGTFLEGLLSFLSPCVLPMVPLYMAYLSGDNKNKDEEGNTKYNQKEVFIKTVFFVLGIFVVFSLLAISIQSIKQYVIAYKDIISIIGSVIVFAFGLHELGVIEISVLNKQATLNDKVHFGKMNYLKAFFFGFFFAFSWTPCIGPMLSSALLLTFSQEGGFVYLLAYALGLTIPFLITGIATSAVLNLLRKYKKFVGVVMKIAGVVLICFSLYMFSNATKNIKGIENVPTKQETKEETIETKKEENKIEKEIAYFPDTEFYDHNGNSVCISDYKDKYVLLNYIATWCTYCKEEIPDYSAFIIDNPDIVCFYVMSPDANGEDESSIKKFAGEYGIKESIIVDSENTIAYYFGISSFPTLCVIGPDGSIIGTASGGLSERDFVEVFNRATKMYEER